MNEQPTVRAGEVTGLLHAWQAGDADALEKLTPLVYDELRRLAKRYLRSERDDHTLQGTALVHEAFVRLIGPAKVDWQSRAHFFAVAARLMRRVLVDHARRRGSAKRGAAPERVPLETLAVFSPARAENLVALDDAMQGLEKFDPAKSRIVELRYFAGLQIDEIADVEKLSVATVRRHLRLAEAWLHRELAGGSAV